MISLDGRGLNRELAQIVNLVLVELKCLLFHIRYGRSAVADGRKESSVAYPGHKRAEQRAASDVLPMVLVVAGSSDRIQHCQQRQR